MSDTNQCGNCTYIFQLGGFTVCRRYPPTVSPMTPSGRANYPAVGQDDWCGEWRAAGVGDGSSGATGELLTSALVAQANQAALLASIQAVTNGGMQISIDGVPGGFLDVSFASCGSLDGAASIITANLNRATCNWIITDAVVGGNFQIYSNSLIDGGLVGFAQPPASGTDIGTMLGLTQAAGATLGGFH
jgi:Protein of unknown function (DUF3383)